MSSVVLISLFCSVIIIFVGVAGLVYILGTHRKSKKVDIQTGAEEASHPTTQAGFVRWIPLVGIALVLALWNVVFALFFLAVVWVLRLNPGPGSNYRLDQDQKDTARRVYTWLFLSPIITVPIFTGLLNYLSLELDKLAQKMR